MPDSYFEGATITIEASETMKKKKFIGTKPYTGPVTLIFEKGSPAKELSKKTENATKGKFDKKITYTAPPVDAAEEYYELRVMCQYKKVNKLLLRTTIWPKESKVQINDDTDKAKSACPFIVRQEGVDQQDLTTDGQGKCNIQLLARKPYTIHMAASYEIKEDKQRTAGQFRDHVLKVRDTIKAKFVSPKVDEAPYIADPDAAPAKKQYVNLPSGTASPAEDGGCDAKGNLVVFTVCADPPESGKKDDKIFFSVTFGKESKRINPAPALGTNIAVLGKSVVDKTTKGYVKLDADGGKAKFEVDLGIGGGDTCIVKIGGTDEVKEGELKLINWRKVYTQITKSATTTAPGLAPAKECLKKVFIELEESTADNVDLAPTDLPAGAIVDGSLLKAGAPAQSLVVGIHNADGLKSKLKARFASENLPCAHLIFCDFQIDANKPPYSSSTPVLGKKTGQTQGMVNFPGGGNVPGLVVEGSAIAGKALLVSIDLNDGSDAVKECKWQEAGGTGNGVITSADYKIDQVGSGNKLFIRLPDAAKTLSDQGKTINVSYKVAYGLGFYNGWCTGTGAHNVIAVGRPDQDICGTIVHEIGHAIQQSPKNAGYFPGLPDPPHARYYTDNRGHQGPHCADGIDDTYYNDVSKRMDTVHAQDRCTCIMFGAGASLRNQTLAFCAKCKPYVMAVSVKKVSG